MSIDDVAQRLGVSRTVVSRLIADGSLPAEKVGNSWVVDVDDVMRVADARRGRARPMSPRMAAAFLDVMAIAEGDPDGGHFGGLSATERHRLRSRLDRLVAASEPSKLLRSWLSKRHPIHRFSMRGSVDDILQEYRCAAAGAAHPRLGLARGPVIDLHVTKQGARGLVADFWLEQDPRGPVRIHVEEEPRVDLAAALADVADLGGPREDHAIAEVIRSWRCSSLQAPPRSSWGGSRSVTGGRFGRLGYSCVMTGLLAVEDVRRLHAALDDLPVEAAREPFLRLLEVLETSPAAAVLPADELLSTQTVADHLGVSRMTVVRLIDRGAIEAAGAGVHRKVRASEVERYLRERTAKRLAAVATLAGDIDADTPVDEVIRTR